MILPWHMHKEALRETQLWCEQHLDRELLEKALASCEVAPGQWTYAIHGHLLENFLRSEVLSPEGYPDLWDSGPMSSKEIEILIQKRKALLAPTTETTSAGRILCVGEYVDTLLGEGETASNGLIDNWYMPPWDCWFAYLPGEKPGEGVLLAWIPDPLIEKVENAIEVAATAPLMWLDRIEEIADWGGREGQERLVQEAHAVLLAGLQP